MQPPRYGREALKAWAAAAVARLAKPRLPVAFGIITYHRLAPLPAGVRRLPLNVTPQRFHDQLAGLLRRGYEPWPLRQALAHHIQGLPIPRRTFVVVFDDGYANVARHALPVLSRLRVPATVLVATGYLDSDKPFPFESWADAGQRQTIDVWQPLSYLQCQTMLDSGWIELGSHTHTHQDFRGRTEELLRDVRTSVELLERRFGIRQPAFSLPYGLQDAQWSERLRATGVSCCLTTDCQLITPGDSPLRWGRFGAEQFDTAETLAAKLDGWFSYCRDAWRTVRRCVRGGSNRLTRRQIVEPRCAESQPRAIV